MAKKKKRSKHIRIGSVRIPRPMIDAAVRAFRSPMGKIILAEALVQGAALLTTRHPTAAAAAAGAGTATAAKDAAGAAGDAVAKFMHSTAEMLKSSDDGTPGRKKDSKRRGETPSATDSYGNGASRGEVFNRDAIREIVVSELSRHKAKKKGKQAERQPAH